MSRLPLHVPVADAAPVKATVMGPNPCVSDGVPVQEKAHTATVLVCVQLASPSVTVSTQVKVPPVVYVWLGLWTAECVVPSPKSQFQESVPGQSPSCWH